MRKTLVLWLALAAAPALATPLFAQVPFGPDERFRTDVLCVFGHPDDEVLVGSLLSRLAFDQKKRLAMVYCTRGGMGANEVGCEHAQALADVREIEGRDALAFWGVTRAWFLDAPDTPGQDVLRSLSGWREGTILERVVRLMRITRPRVVLTFLPAMTVGECHGDHQAAGVIATEAFDLAGDPSAFAHQLAAPRDPTRSGNFGEGLAAWQPQKLYYFSDADATVFLDGKGPAYRSSEVSPSKQRTYQHLAAEEASRQDSQDVGVIAKQFLRTNKFPLLLDPERLAFARAAVPHTTSGDIFENTTDAPVAFAPPVRTARPPARGVWLELGGAWAFYRELHRAHGLTHLDDVPAPEASTDSAHAVRVPLLLHNDGTQPVDAVLRPALPPGWIATAGAGAYRLEPHATWPVEARVLAKGQNGTRGAVRWDLDAGAQGATSVSLSACLSGNDLPQ